MAACQGGRHRRPGHMGLRGPTKQLSWHQSALALDRYPNEGPHDGRKLLSEGPCGSLRRRWKVRIFLRSPDAHHHRVREWTSQPDGIQIGHIMNSTIREPVEGIEVIPHGKTCGGYIAQALHAYGVTHVFFVDAILRRTLVAMESLGIKRILTHSEKAASYMADGYARIAKRPGVSIA